MHNSQLKTVKSSDNTAEYEISDLALEYEVVTNRDLAQTIRQMHRQKVHYFFDRTHTHEVRQVNKMDTLWNVQVNQTIKSLKGILICGNLQALKIRNAFTTLKLLKQR